MTYSTGGLIQATDFNTFVSTGSPNINNIWGTGSTDSGWGQTALSTVSTGGTVAATNWASLVNTLSSMGSHTGTTITSRTAPVAGGLVSVLANVSADITSLNTNRGFAAARGTEYGTFSGTTSKTTATGSGQTGWTITFQHVLTFASTDAARYFWNAGGMVRLQFAKSSTGTDTDPDWNTLAGKCGSIYFVGRIGGAAQTIAGTSYTGTTRIGGTGGTQTTLASNTGWYNITTGSDLFQLNNDVAPYTGEYIRVLCSKVPDFTTTTFTTYWVSDGSSGAGTSANISGGTATTSPSTTITGTAPTTLLTYFPPSTTYLTNSWGTPTITASVT